MRVSEATAAQAGVVGNMREGVLEQKFLLTGQDGSPNNYVLNVGRTGAGGWTTPRHRHNFDQVRYVLKGNYPYAPGKTLPEGWVAYFPEGVYYGPQDRPEGLEMMVLQMGGASGQGYISVAQREAANELLKKKGEFKDGVFTWFDENGKRHNQDGFEACYEQVMGREMSYPKPRYEELVVMNPANFEWIADAEEGISTKTLGVFTERQTRIGFVRLEAGATLAAGLEPSIQLLFLSEGRVTVEGREHGRHTAFEFLANEGPVAVKALERTEFFQIVLPRL